MEELILATDLTYHFLNTGKIRQLTLQIDTFPITWNKQDTRKLIRNLLMTVGDLCGQAKPFNTAKRIVQNVMTEFYNEGRILKSMNIEVLPMMNINYASQIPIQQVQFIDVVCLPCFSYLSIILPTTIQIEHLCK